MMMRKEDEILKKKKKKKNTRGRAERSSAEPCSNFTEQLSSWRTEKATDAPVGAL